MTQGETVWRCPFCQGVCAMHCAKAQRSKPCDLRKCLRPWCKAYGRARDASRWVRPVAE